MLARKLCCWDCRIASRTDAEHDTVRDKLRIDCTGDNLPPPITSFRAMRLPRATLKCLKRDKIKTPTPIQIQGLPVILSGRDCVGVSYTGSGKTLAFALPMILMALQVQARLMRNISLDLLYLRVLLPHTITSSCKTSHVCGPAQSHQCGET